MVQLEMLFLNFLARILLRLKGLFNRLHLTHLNRILSRCIKKVDINIYDNDAFLNYVLAKHLGLKKNIKDIETIALRGSTADYGFDPDYFPNSYNLGLTSSDLHFAYLQYKSVLKEGGEIKNIIVFASFSMIGFSLPKTIEKNRLMAYYTAFNIAIPKSHKFKKRYLKHIEKKLTTLKTDLIVENYNGYEKKVSFMVNKSSLERRLITHTRENKRVPNQLNWLKRIDTKTQKNNHKLFIVLPPFRSDYKEEMPSFDEGYKQLLSLNFQNSEILNFHNSELFNDSDFGDLDHLNEHGAKKLTTELFTIIHHHE